MPQKASRSINFVDDDDAMSQHSKAPDSDDRELEYVFFEPLHATNTPPADSQSVRQGRCRVQGYVRQIYTPGFLFVRIHAATPHTVTWQKQKKEKEKKFLKAAQAQLDEHVRALCHVCVVTRLFIASFL